MNITIVGLGLIGGSMGLDLKNLGQHLVIHGMDQSAEHEAKALELGIIDQVADQQTLGTSDMVILAVPVDAALRLLPSILDQVKDDAVVVDVGSTKQAICQSVASHPKRRNFLATHPIAGTEFSGPEAAVLGLFRGKTNIICEVEKTAFKLQEKVLKLFYEMGMRLRYMDPVAHDKHIAYVSHLSHISSFMLGKTVIEKEKNERDIFDMAGSGFESTVRLAKSSPLMWRPIFEQNKANVIETLDEYIANLVRFRELMEAGEFGAIEDEMANTNRIKEILKGITVKTT